MKIKSDIYSKYFTLTPYGCFIRFNQIPGGIYEIGSPSSEKGRDTNEELHSVDIKDFWLSNTVCPQELYQYVMKDNPSQNIGNTLPVTNVTWYDCCDFLKKLKKYFNNDFLFRLPTEEEWEVACRANTISPYNVDIPVVQHINCFSSIIDSKLLPVKFFPPNEWGLFQMHGNVREWCQNEYRPYALNRRYISTDKEYVARGGSWFDHAIDCRSAKRFKLSPQTYDNNLGFRFVCEVNNEKN